MPAHSWTTYYNGTRRICDACEVEQKRRVGEWVPEVKPICPGDDRDTRRRKPSPPASDAPKKELETI